MKFSTAFLTAIAVGGSGAADAMTIRGDSHSAQTLMQKARRVEDAGNGQSEFNYAEMSDNYMYFLRDYSIKLLSCVNEEATTSNNEEGEGEREVDSESSSVIFRLCPSSSCSANSLLGCEEGNGDYIIGINTFVQAYFDSLQEKEYYREALTFKSSYGEELDISEYAYCGEYRAQGQGQAQQQNNNGYNQQNGQWWNYNGNQQQYGQNGYRQYNNNVNYGQSGYQQYNNNGYSNANTYYNQRGNQRKLENNNQFFLGPACTNDGMGIRLALFSDDACSYETGVSFSQISYGWRYGLPFEDGGLVPQNICLPCLYRNQNYEYTTEQMCSDVFRAATYRCELNMNKYSYAGRNTLGCSHIEELEYSVFGDYIDSGDAAVSSNGTSTSWGLPYNVTWDPSRFNVTWDPALRFMDRLNQSQYRGFIAAMVILSVAAFLTCCMITTCCWQKTREIREKKRTQALVDKDVYSPPPRMSVVDLVRSGSKKMADVVSTNSKKVADVVSNMSTNSKKVAGVVSTMAAGAIYEIKTISSHLSGMSKKADETESNDYENMAEDADASEEEGNYDAPKVITVEADPQAEEGKPATITDSSLASKMEDYFENKIV
jgi:hypothetical protein